MKTRYDLWVEAEINKIKEEYNEKRQVVLDKLFEAGMAEKSKFDKDIQVLRDEYRELDKQERVAVDKFMKQIQSK